MNSNAIIVVRDENLMSDNEMIKIRVSLRDVNRVVDYLYDYQQSDKSFMIDDMIGDMVQDLDVQLLDLEEEIDVWL